MHGQHGSLHYDVIKGAGQHARACKGQGESRAWGLCIGYAVRCQGRGADQADAAHQGDDHFRLWTTQKIFIHAFKSKLLKLSLLRWKGMGDVGEEEEEVFFVSGMTKENLARQFWKRLSKPMIWVHLAVAAAHFYSLGSNSVETPFHSVPAPVVAEPAATEPAAPPAELKISDLLASDPMTMLFDATALLMKDRQPPHPPAPRQPACENKKREKRQAPSWFLPVAVNAAAITLMALLDSDTRQIWPSCMLCSALVAIICRLLHDKDFAACFSMHASCLIMGASSCYHYGTGLLLTLLSQIYVPQLQSAEEFYMHHSWAAAVLCSLGRCIVQMVLIKFHNQWLLFSCMFLSSCFLCFLLTSLFREADLASLSMISIANFFWPKISDSLSPCTSPS